MTNDELAEAFGKLMTELHAKIDAMPDGPVRTRAQHQAAVIHELLERLRAHLADAGEVQPFSGGDPKPPPPPAP